jgi:hypothetical protein
VQLAVVAWRVNMLQGQSALNDGSTAAGDGTCLNGTTRMLLCIASAVLVAWHSHHDNV